MTWIRNGMFRRNKAMATKPFLRNVLAGLEVVLFIFGSALVQPVMSTPVYAAVTAMTVTVVLPPSAPVITPSAGTYTLAQTITISSVGSDSIRYTTNGADPSCLTGTLYAGAFTLFSSASIKAVGCIAASVVSPVSVNTYTINISSNTGGAAGIIPVKPRAITSDVVLTLALDHVEQLGNGMARVWINLNADPKSVRGFALSTDPLLMEAGLITYDPWVSITVPIIPSIAIIYGRYYSVTGAPSNIASLMVNVAIDAVVTPPTAVPIEFVLDPSDLSGLLVSLNLVRKPVAEENIVLQQVKADAKEFGLLLNDEQIQAVRNFIVYGISSSTIKFGQGERRAIMRDYMDTVHRPDMIWSDVERITNGQIPTMRNLERERLQVSDTLPVFSRLFGHTPNFQNATENLAWNTLMYRIRFPRDLVKERKGILAYVAIYAHTPTSPFGWSVVRVLGYVK